MESDAGPYIRSANVGHVTACRLTQSTRVLNAVDDAAGNNCLALLVPPSLGYRMPLKFKDRGVKMQ